MSRESKSNSFILPAGNNQVVTFYGRTGVEVLTGVGVVHTVHAVSGTELVNHTLSAADVASGIPEIGIFSVFCQTVIMSQRCQLFRLSLNLAANTTDVGLCTRMDAVRLHNLSNKRVRSAYRDPVQRTAIVL